MFGGAMMKGVNCVGTSGTNLKLRRFLILLNCCFSGLLGNLPNVDNTKVFLREGISILTAGKVIRFP
jgi:hypothetical protein